MHEETIVQDNAWNVLLVEDDETIRQQVVDYFSQMSFDSRSLNIREIDNLSIALSQIRERKADLIILDVYRGIALQGGEQIGIQILNRIKDSGFVPIILYTALPEGLEEYRSAFVRLVGKDVGGLEKLKEEIDNLFRLRIPQINRAIINHIDQTMRDYMWEFVQTNWDAFRALINKPEFLRLIIQHLARTFAREGIDNLTAEVYGTEVVGQTAEDIVHPAEYYIKPPISSAPLFGDIRVRKSGETNEYLVILWPSCDMIPRKNQTGQGEEKTEFALCAHATQAGNACEVAEWLSSTTSNSRQKKVERLVSNNREGMSRDRYHFLPGVWDIPSLVVDFQMLEHVALKEIKNLSCLATLASPFAEAFGARFRRYIGRIGTPDLDIKAVLEQLKNSASPAPDCGISTE